ncbi:MAG: hypothetical protein GY820_38880 [Gammaproteobacteria bacterium]|nr:hypothetical protein [Gammaproteobacteria bacterium]
MADKKVTALDALATVDDADVLLIVDDVAGTPTSKKITRANLINAGIADDNVVEIDDADAADNDYARFTANGLEGRSYAEVQADLSLEIGTDVLAEQTIGIADDNLLEVDDADAADNDYAKFTANGLEGRSYAEVKADLDLEIGTDVLAEQTIGIADDNLLEVDDADAADDDFARFTANGLEGRSAAEVRADLSLESDDLKAPENFIVALSDETTDLTTGTAKVTFRMPYAFTLTDVRASVNTAPTGATITVDINEGGTTILSTKLTIDATEKTSESAATPAVISDSSLADDAEMTFDIDQIGSSAAGKGLKIVLIGTRS